MGKQVLQEGTVRVGEASPGRGLSDEMRGGWAGQRAGRGALQAGAAAHAKP